MDLLTILIGCAMLESFQSWPMWRHERLKNENIDATLYFHDTWVARATSGIQVICWIAFWSVFCSLLSRDWFYPRTGDEAGSHIFRTKLGHSAIRMSDDDRDIDIESDVNSTKYFAREIFSQTHVSFVFQEEDSDSRLRHSNNAQFFSQVSVTIDHPCHRNWVYRVLPRFSSHEIS